jgi:hypothetical protein
MNQQQQHQVGYLPSPLPHLVVYVGPEIQAKKVGTPVTTSVSSQKRKEKIKKNPGYGREKSQRPAPTAPTAPTTTTAPTAPTTTTAPTAPTTTTASTAPPPPDVVQIETASDEPPEEPKESIDVARENIVINRYYPVLRRVQPKLKNLNLEQLLKLNPEPRDRIPPGRFCGRCHFPLTAKHSVSFPFH